MTGKWKIKTISTFDPEVGLKTLTLDEVLAMPEGEEKAELMQMANVVFIITEDKFTVTTPIPADQIEEAKASGMTVTDDGLGIMEEYQVKVEDGIYYYLTNTTGEIMGESIDPWQKMELDENGNFVFNPLMLFEKI